MNVKKICILLACVSVSGLASAQALEKAAEAVGTAIGKAAGTAAKDIGKGVNIGMGGNDAEEKLLIRSKVETGKVTQEAVGSNSKASTSVGGISGNAGKNVDIDSTVTTKDIQNTARDGGSSTISIGVVGR